VIATTNDQAGEALEKLMSFMWDRQSNMDTFVRIARRVGLDW